MARPLPPSAAVAIIGGGVFGCAAAMYLTRAKAGRVVLIEAATSASGNTALAAGLISRVRMHVPLMPLIEETWQTIREFEDEEPGSTGLHRNGQLQVVGSDSSKHILDALVAHAARFQIAQVELDAEQTRRSVPWLNAAVIKGAVLFPDDGFVDPYLLTQSYAHRAHQLGAVMADGVRVLSILGDEGGVSGVLTDAGTISTPAIINATGVWANGLTRPIGCHVPVAAVRSHYWLTQTDPDRFQCRQPAVVLPDAHAYTRPELGALLLGLREPSPLVVDPSVVALAGDTHWNRHDPMGWHAFGDSVNAVEPFFPGIAQVGIAHYVAGLSAYSPDGLPVIGGFAQMPGLFAVAGAGMGIAISAGAARALTALVLESTSHHSVVHPFRPDRFGEIDPGSNAFQRQCALARATKQSG